MNPGIERDSIGVSKSRAWLVSCWLSAGLLFGSGLAFRSIQGNWNLQPSSVSIPPSTLDQIPLHTDSWTGIDEPLLEDVARATDTDQQINRFYTRAGVGGVTLFVGYGGRIRDLAPHRPDVCFPSAGWTLQRDETAEIELKDDVLRARVFCFSKSGLDPQNVTVLSTYLINDHFSADFSDLRELARHSRVKNYYARIQITAADFQADRAEELLHEFAREIAPSIRNVVQQQVNRQ